MFMDPIKWNGCERDGEILIRQLCFDFIVFGVGEKPAIKRERGREKEQCVYSIFLFQNMRPVVLPLGSPFLVWFIYSPQECCNSWGQNYPSSENRPCNYYRCRIAEGHWGVKLYKNVCKKRQNMQKAVSVFFCFLNLPVCPLTYFLAAYSL